MKRKENENENEDLVFKLITIGDSNVGKTSIITRYMTNDFDQSNISSIGLSFSFKTIKLKNGKKIQLKLVDTAGQEKYKALTKSYFKNVDGVLFVFDFSKLNTFEHIEDWIDLFEESNNDKEIPKYLIGNKNDLEKKVDQKLIDNFIKRKEYKYKFEECSALNNNNIEKIFQEISEKIYDNYLLTEKKQKQKVIKIINSNEKDKTSNCFLCGTDMPDYNR